jgi:ATP-dependent DNA helicase RecQ
MLDSLARAGLLTLTNDTFRTPEGRDITYRKVAITHEGRTPDDETLSTVWLRDTASTTSSKRATNRTSKRDSKRRATPTHEPARRAREPQSQLPIARREVTAPTPRKPTPPEPAEFNPTQTALDTRLRAWRKEQAHAAGLPSFFIFSDSVLRDIVLASPASLSDLRSIRGLGPDKLDRFGPAVLELCRAT